MTMHCVLMQDYTRCEAQCIEHEEARKQSWGGGGGGGGGTQIHSHLPDLMVEPLLLSGSASFKLSLRFMEPALTGFA